MTSFDEVLDALAATARESEDVVGLVAFGSTADRSRTDAGSDHDFARVEDVFRVARGGRTRGPRPGRRGARTGVGRLPHAGVAAARRRIEELAYAGRRSGSKSDGSSATM
ncbi:hypothetical protein [Nocardioides sp. T2.26MG-1]|uniref:hypothetical protein n=1 Tax=Nocardioides sp. T2.26MG-1 TaxID=3041166 RepID=UPI0024773335|nr:hypothetical protein [Nocardioides sp. T2.26MG-1]CAI9403191.1 hypothetical protein HIDPHFAB_00968 [Nocardioides sp. T2.26MG-1]